MDNCLTIWTNGYRHCTGVSAFRVAETDKAIQFRLLEDENVTFWFPKVALRHDKNLDGVLNVAPWFKIRDYLAYVWQRYGSVYPR